MVPKYLQLVTTLLVTAVVSALYLPFTVFQAVDKFFSIMPHSQPDNEVKVIVHDDWRPGHTLTVHDPRVLGIDDTVQYSGVLTSKYEHKLFYWLVESRNDPKNDPLMIWMNGGPGSTSLLGMLYELGPSFIDKDLNPVRNPNSFNSNATVIFVDQPANVGFSSGHKVNTTEQAAKDFHEFLELFFSEYPQYANLDLTIAGESYGGHYVPVFANELVKQGVAVDSIMVGNGMTEPYRQYQYYGKFACEENNVLDDHRCRMMELAVPVCTAGIELCYENIDNHICKAATEYCNSAILDQYQSTGRNMYDIRKMTDQDAVFGYPDQQYVIDYLNQDYVQAALGVSKKFEMMSQDLYDQFMSTGDWMWPYYHTVKELLDADVDCLLYAGDQDFICNWLGIQKFLEAEPFNLPHDVRQWSVDGNPAGSVQKDGRLTFMRVYDAGHFVPYDQGVHALAMANTWLVGSRKFT